MWGGVVGWGGCGGMGGVWGGVVGWGRGGRKDIKESYGGDQVKLIILKNQNPPTRTPTPLPQLMNNDRSPFSYLFIYIFFILLFYLFIYSFFSYFFFH